MMAEIQNEMEQTNSDTKMVISARLGPRGASFFPERTLIMTEDEAEEYHKEQINWLAQTEADMVSKIKYFFNFLTIRELHFDPYVKFVLL